MGLAAFKDASKGLVAITLTGGRVTSGFRAALFSEAGRAGVSVNELVLRAAGEKLARSGVNFPGVFNAGDCSATSESN